MNALEIPVGYRQATYGDEPTHAICVRHGRLSPIEADSHPCSWVRLVEKPADQHSEDAK